MMKLSVALCTYNGEKYIKEQLDSILKQEMRVDEVIVCDDCSKDNTMSIVKEYASTCNDVSWKIINNTCNVGVTKNFERAMTECSGDIIFLSDQDDVWMPNKTRMIVEHFMKSLNVDVVFSDAFLIDGKGDYLFNRRLFEIVGMTQLRDLWEAGMAFEMVNKNDRATGATMACRSRFLSEAIPFDTTQGELHDGLLCAAGIKQCRIGVIWEPLIKYRIHTDNVMGLDMERIKCIPKRKELMSLVFNPIYPLKKCFSEENHEIEERVLFYRKRIFNYYTIKGKLLLLCSLIDYLRYYRIWGIPVLCRDLTFGFTEYIKKRL